MTLRLWELATEATAGHQQRTQMNTVLRLAVAPDAPDLAAIRNETCHELWGPANRKNSSPRAGQMDAHVDGLRSPPTASAGHGHQDSAILI